jgi:hypothetical protein
MGDRHDSGDSRSRLIASTRFRLDVLLAVCLAVSYVAAIYVIRSEDVLPTVALVFIPLVLIAVPEFFKRLPEWVGPSPSTTETYVTGWLLLIGMGIAVTMRCLPVRCFVEQ